LHLPIHHEDGYPKMTSRDVITLVLLILISVFLYADQNVVNPVIQELQQEYGVPKDKIGIIGSAFLLLGALVSLIWGYYTDKVSRKNLLVFTVLLGEIPCFLCGFRLFTQTYEQFLFLRILTGIGVGGIFPLTYSLVADYFKAEHRVTAVAWVGVAWAVGQVMGQAIAGFLVEDYGWRLPFILVSVPNYVLVPLFFAFAREPKRGATEEQLEELFQAGREYTSVIKPSDFKRILRIPTNVLAFLQGVPGTLPWGILPFFFVDFYREVKGFHADIATSLTVIFGMGTILGGLIGGHAGQELYKRNPKYLPFFSGLSIVLGVFPWYYMTAMQFPPDPGWSEFILPSIVGFFAGVIVSLASANVKALLMAVNPPENRGSAFAIFNLTDSIGKGIGPWLGGLLIKGMGYGFTLNFAISWWIPSGILFLLIIFTVERDKRRMEEHLHRMAR
jgi:MFS family permease